MRPQGASPSCSFFVRVIVIVIVLAIIVRAEALRNRRLFSLQCPCGGRRTQAMLAQPKMTSRHGLSQYRGLPVESSCLELDKFSLRRCGAAAIDYDYDYEHEERARQRREVR